MDTSIYYALHKITSYLEDEISVSGEVSQLVGAEVKKVREYLQEIKKEHETDKE